MLGYVLSRLLTFLPTFLGVTLVSFSFIRMLPGDPIVVMAGERGVTPERYKELVEQFGLLLIALMVMIVNLTVDILYGYINPKIRKR